MTGEDRMSEVEAEAERLYRNLHCRQHVGFVNGFRSALLDLRRGGERGLRAAIDSYRPTSKYGVPTDEYEVGFERGMRKALKVFLGGNES